MGEGGGAPGDGRGQWPELRGATTRGDDRGHELQIKGVKVYEGVELALHAGSRNGGIDWALRAALSGLNAGFD